MDITVKYTDEEKVLFDEVFRLKEQVRILEDEVFLLRREKQEHTQANHTEGIPPIVFMILSMLNILLFAADLIVGFGTLDINRETIMDPQMYGHMALSIAFAAGTPTLAVIFAVLFVVSYRKYFFQVTKDPVMQEKAKKLNIKNYHVEEARIDAQYNEAFRKLSELKEIYNRKNDELEALVAKRTREADEERDREIAKRNENKKNSDLKIEVKKQESIGKKSGEEKKIEVVKQDPIGMKTKADQKEIKDSRDESEKKE